MKKISAFLLAVFMMIGCALFSVNVHARETGELIHERDLSIEAAFTDLNESALAQKQNMFKKESGLISEDEYRKKLDEIRGRQAETEKKLARLGVHKIDPNDADDVKRLMEIMGSEATENSYKVKGAGEKSSTPPDFSSLASKYSIYQQYGSYTVNGTSYQYTYIHVIDNKNQSTPLTVSNLFAMYGKQSTLLSNLLAYQFSFAVSAFWGTIPYGTLIDWTLGTVFTILQSMGGNSNVVCSGNQNIYTLSLLSVTHMLYIYTYTNANGWALSGSRAPDISFARADSFVANVQGTAVSDAKSSSWNSSTGNGITWYVANYINTGVAVYSTPGSLFAKRGSVNVGTFSPGFCSVPGYL